MKKILFLAAIVVLCTCTKTNGTFSNALGEATNNSMTIPLSMALQSLDEMLEDIRVVTKSSVNKEYSSSSVISLGAGMIRETKTDILGWDLPDTLMYLVNFDHDEGFAVLAGDRRLGESVYCLTESGEIGANDFFVALDYLAGNSVETKADSNEDGFYDIGMAFVPAFILSSMIIDLADGVDNIETKTIPVVTYNQALLNTKWGQYEPFNTYTPADGNVPHCPTGCTPTACAQIMAYCEKPVYPDFDGVPCSWSTIKTVCTYLDPYGLTASGVAKEQVAKFLFHLGKSHLCNVSYSATGSGAYAAGAQRTLNYYGYSNVKRYLGFGSTNQSRASTMLSNNKPVLLSGFDSHNGGGHTWVIDGEYNGYYHCNWGWYGAWDGYFAKHNWFKLSYRNSLDSKDSGGTNSLNKDYDWNFRLVTYSL
ncbi:MAG: C10 family peptidase [Bacteroidales bacterium]|nr:C10 family peptidase [Bacteroidales bacterium]